MRVRKRIISEVRGCNDKAEQTKSLALILFYQMRLLQNESKANGMTQGEFIEWMMTEDDE